MKRLTTNILCAAIVLTAGAAHAFEPVLAEALADPEVYFEDGYWYVFGTGWWTMFVGEELAPEKMERVRMELDYGALGGPYEVWRFTVYKHTDGTYHAYVTVHFGHFKTGLAHFVPAAGQEWKPGAPIRKWVLDKQLATGPDPEVPSGGYDVTMVRDEDGTLYLLYVYGAPGAEGGHIMAQRMLNPYDVDRGFAPRPILGPQGFRSEDRNPGFIQLVEGPRVRKWGAKYVLTYSVGDFRDYPGVKNNYKIGVAYSDTLIPPEGETYRKPLILDPDNVWGNMDWGEIRPRSEVCYLMQSQVETWPNYSGDWVAGPGHGSIVMRDGKPWLFFHGYPTGENKEKYSAARWDWLLPLAIDIDEDKPMAEWIRVLPPGETEPRPIAPGAP